MTPSSSTGSAGVATAAAAAAQMGGDMGAMNNLNSMAQTFQPGYPFLPYYDQNGFMAAAGMSAAQQRAAAQLGNPGAAAAMRLIPRAVLMNPAAGKIISRLVMLVRSMESRYRLHACYFEDKLI